MTPIESAAFNASRALGSLRSAQHWLKQSRKPGLTTSERRACLYTARTCMARALDWAEFARLSQITHAVESRRSP
jgi:hypothetical protein